MRFKCPYCSPEAPNTPGRVRKYGHHYRRCDRKYVPRFRCMACGKYFSQATFDPCYRQSTRQFNQQVFEGLASLTSQRRLARNSELCRGTIARKLKFLGEYAELRLHAQNRARPAVEHCQFDDLETFEHTKMKPLSVTLAVSNTRRILALEVASMPAKGLLAAASRKKYGRRKDERNQMRAEMFKNLLPIVSPTALIRSDQNPYYAADVKRFFANATYETFKGRKPRNQGQGELKVGGHDPLWALNHTAAMNRANVNRLIRKTWCTTKKASCLRLHLHIYADYHNEWIATQRRPDVPTAFSWPLAKAAAQNRAAMDRAS